MRDKDWQHYKSRPLDTYLAVSADVSTGVGAVVLAVGGVGAFVDGIGAAVGAVVESGPPVGAVVCG